MCAKVISDPLWTMQTFDYLCIISAQLIREHLGERGFPVVSCEHLHGSVQSSAGDGLGEWSRQSHRWHRQVETTWWLHLRKGLRTWHGSWKSMAWFVGWPTLSWVQKEPTLSANNTLRDRRITIVMVHQCQCHVLGKSINSQKFLGVLPVCCRFLQWIFTQIDLPSGKLT